MGMPRRREKRPKRVRPGAGGDEKGHNLCCHYCRISRTRQRKRDVNYLAWYLPFLIYRSLSLYIAYLIFYHRSLLVLVSLPLSHNCRCQSSIFPCSCQSSSLSPSLPTMLTCCVSNTCQNTFCENCCVSYLHIDFHALSQSRTWQCAVCLVLLPFPLAIFHTFTHSRFLI